MTQPATPACRMFTLLRRISSIETYERTFDQNEELGLNDMKVEGYEEVEKNTPGTTFGPGGYTPGTTFGPGRWDQMMAQLKINI